MSPVTVSSKYQISIPACEREEGDITPGKEYMFFVDGDQIRLVPVLPIEEMRGIAKGCPRWDHDDNEECEFGRGIRGAV